MRSFRCAHRWAHRCIRFFLPHSPTKLRNNRYYNITYFRLCLFIVFINTYLCPMPRNCRAKRRPTSTLSRNPAFSTWTVVLPPPHPGGGGILPGGLGPRSDAPGIQEASRCRPKYIIVPGMTGLGRDELTALSPS
jgi:hypothetical protein